MFEVDDVQEDEVKGFSRFMQGCVNRWWKQKSEEDAQRTQPKHYAKNSERTLQAKRKFGREYGSFISDFFSPWLKKPHLDEPQTFVDMRNLEVAEPEEVQDDQALIEVDSNIVEADEDVLDDVESQPEVEVADLNGAETVMGREVEENNAPEMPTAPDGPEGEDPEDLKRNIWSDRQLISLVGGELRRMLMKHNSTLQPQVKARVLGMLALVNFYTNHDEQLTWQRASLVAAKASGRGSSFARNLRRWTIAYAEGECKFDTLPHAQYAAFRTAFLDDEDLSQRIKQHLQTLGRYFRAQDIVDFVASEEMQACMGTREKKSISIRTAQRWLNKHYRYGHTQKGMYIDGHERDDVVEYRKAFLTRMDEYSQRMATFDVVDGEMVITMPTLRDGEKFLVLVTHDESTFYENDRKRRRWISNEETPVPQPKGEGSSIMVSDFLSPYFGRLCDGDWCV